MFFGVAVIILQGCFVGHQTSFLPGWLAVSTGLLCLVGMIDDRHMLSAWGKLPGQILAVLPIVVAGLSVERIGLFGWELPLGWLAVPWTIGWLLLGINAFNLLDGSDGLASTVGLLTALALAAVAGVLGSWEASLLALALAGGLAGFLVYNLPPARIYLGDCGSTVIGFVLAALALHACRIDSAAASLPVMGLLLFVPLLDTGLAIVRRLLKGQTIWSGDRAHLHHQLKDRGLRSGGVLIVLGAFCLVSGVAAWAAVFWRQELLAVVVLGGVTGGLIWRQWIAREEWSLLVHLLARRAGTAADPSVQPVRRRRPLRVLRPKPSHKSTRGSLSPMAGERGEHERRAA